MSSGMPSWLFKVALNAEAGGGHLARALAVADALSERGETAVFSLDRAAAGVGTVIAARGHGMMTERYATNGTWRGVFLDDYGVSAAEAGRLRQQAGLLVAIVDEKGRLLPADLVIAPGADMHAGKATVLHGFDHALIDRAFSRIGPVTEPEALLVCFGLRDSVNATSLVLRGLDTAAWSGPLAVAIGGAAPHLAEIRGLLADKPGAELFLDRPLTETMPRFDIVIGGGGVGLLERMAAGRPSLTILQAKNQLAQAMAAAAQGATVLVGHAADLTPWDVATQLMSLNSDPARKVAMSAAGRRLVDGEGAARVAAAMIAQADALAAAPQQRTQRQ